MVDDDDFYRPLRWHQLQAKLLLHCCEQGWSVALALSVMGAFARFERELIRERQREGIAIAKREGKYTGRKPSLSPTRAAELRRRVADGNSKAALAREFGISRDTLYRYVPVKKRRARKFAK